MKNRNSEFEVINGTFFCWKSLLVGLVVTLFSSMLLTSIGAGIAGFTADGLISQESGGIALLSGVGIFLVLVAVVSLAVGAFFAVRMAHSRTKTVSTTHAIVLTAVTFLLLASGVTSVIGGILGGLGSVLGSTGTSVANVAENPKVQDEIDSLLGSSKLKSDTKEVVKGVAVRVANGDADSVKRYLAYETGMPESEISDKVQKLMSDTKANAKVAAEKSARAAGSSGFAVALVMLLGLGAAVGGASLALKKNLENPLSRES